MAANPVSGAVGTAKTIAGYTVLNKKFWMAAGAFTLTCGILAPTASIAAVTSTLPQATTVTQTASNAWTGLTATWSAGAPEIIPAAKVGAGKIGTFLTTLSNG